MKICAIICEYNPFHNGHEYLLREAKIRSGADAVLCIMSGNFIQRGEAAILEKHIRAKHAVECGADIVIELPTVFATSNAEVFARGAISILSKIPSITHLCFGAETADKEAFQRTARALTTEPETVSEEIKAQMKKGVSYAAAVTEARKKHLPTTLFTTPNNILGLEYTKALLSIGSPIEILPVQRVGANYLDACIHAEYSSATAIRAAAFEGRIYDVERQTPKQVFDDLLLASKIDLSLAEKLAILNVSTELLATTLDCSEGLENAFKTAATSTKTLEESLVSTRYTASRIRRIALQNLLNVRKDFIFECLSNPLYIHPLAYKSERTDLLSALSKASIPFLSSGKEKRSLTRTAKACLSKDEYAEQVYSVLAEQEFEHKTILL